MNINLQNISKKYDKENVIENLSLNIPQGKLTALLGPSGCGKTTLLNIIAGLIKPTSGKVYFNNECVSALPISKRNIGYVFQNYALYPNMTVYNNIKFPLINGKPKKINRKEYKKQIDEKIHTISKLLQIEEYLSKYPSELSGGQQQRVAIARAIIREPSILLMDEPFANLDNKLSVAMREEIRELQQKLGTTTIFVTHNQTDANAIADNIIVLYEGKIQQQDSPENLYNNPSNLFVADFIGEYGINILDGEVIENNFCYNNSKIRIENELHGKEDIKYLCFRPEHVMVADNKLYDLKCTVKSAMLDENYIVYTLNFENKQLIVKLMEKFNVGDDIYLKINKVLFFNSDKNKVNL